MSVKKLIAGNWKMNGRKADALALAAICWRGCARSRRPAT